MPVIGLAFGVWLIVVIGAIFLTTLGTDEAWVLNGLKRLLQLWTADVSVEPISSNGSLSALANLVLELMFGSIVWVHRVFLLTSLLAVVAALRFRWPNHPMNISFRLLIGVPFLALSGTAETGTTALGTSTAV